MTVNVDLDFTLTADPAGDVIAGQPIVYTLSATNNGRSTALDVVMTDTFGMLLSPTASPGCTLLDSTFTCTIDDGVAMNETEIITVTGVVSPSAPSPLDNSGAMIWLETGERQTDTITSNVLADIDFDIDLAPLNSVVLTAGRPVSYTVALTNTGDSVAPDVLITGTLTHLTNVTAIIVGSGTPCTVTTTLYSCAVGTLAAQTGQGTVRIQGTLDPTARGTLSNAVSVSAQVSPTVTVNRLFTNLITDDVNFVPNATRTPNSPIAGGQVQYTFSVQNTGDSTALNVVLTDTLSKVLTPTVSFVTSQGSCAANDFVVTCTFGNLPKNTTATVTISATVDPAEHDIISNNYNIASPDVPTITGSLGGSLQRQAVLLPSVSARSVVTAGMPISYTVSLTNQGPSTATSPTLTATLSNLTNPTEVSASCAITGTLLSCAPGTLGVNQTFSVQINGTAAVDARGSIVNTFHGDATEAAHVSANGTTTVQRNVRLGISMNSFPNGSVRAGETLRYTVTLSNTGVSAALDTVITATTLSLVPPLIITPSGDCSLTGTLLTCDVGTLAPGGSYALTYRSTTDPAKRGVLTNSTGATEIDQSTPVTDSASITVNALSELILDVEPSSPVIAGGSLTYTVALVNEGPSSASNAVLTGTLGLAVIPTISASGCTAASGAFTCTIGQMMPDEPISMTVTIPVPGTRRSQIVSLFRANAVEDVSNLETITSNVTANVLLDAQIQASGVITPNAPITLTTTLENSGISTGLSTTLTYTYTHLAAAPTASVAGVTGTCTPNHAQQRVVCAFNNNFTGNSSATVTLAGTLAATLPPTLTHSALVAAQNPATSDPATITLTRGESYPLALEMYATGVVTSSQPLTYTLLLANNSGDDVSAVVLTHTYASITAAPTVNVTGESATCTPDHTNLRVVCDFGTFSEGGTATVTVRGTLAGSLPSTLNSGATLRTGSPAATVTESLPLVRNSSTPLQLNITATGTVTNSAPITYTLHLTNSAPVAVGSIIITDSYANAVTGTPSVTVIPTGAGTCAVHPASSQRRVVCTFEDFPANSTAKVRIVAQLGSGVPSTISNDATLRASQPALTLTDNLTLNRNSTYLTSFLSGMAGLWWVIPYGARRFRKKRALR